MFNIADTHDDVETAEREYRATTQCLLAKAYEAAFTGDHADFYVSDRGSGLLSFWGGPDGRPDEMIGVPLPGVLALMAVREVVENLVWDNSNPNEDSSAFVPIDNAEIGLWSVVESLSALGDDLQELLEKSGQLDGRTQVTLARATAELKAELRRHKPAFLYRKGLEEALEDTRRAWADYAKKVRQKLVDPFQPSYERTV